MSAATTYPQTLSSVGEDNNFDLDASRRSGITLTATTSLDYTQTSPFSKCPLIEIIHIHQALRNSYKAFVADVELLMPSKSKNFQKSSREMRKILGRAIGRFKVIHSVFVSHSKAEDEFIWPAMQRKVKEIRERFVRDGAKDEKQGEEVQIESLEKMIKEEEYEDDHDVEEKMLDSLEEALSRVRNFVAIRPEGGTAGSSVSSGGDSATEQEFKDGKFPNGLIEALEELYELAAKSHQFLVRHLEKEESQCMPLIQQHFTHSELEDMVGNIMGKRSSDKMREILKISVENLPEGEREDMRDHMVACMKDTFFEKWLSRLVGKGVVFNYQLLFVVTNSPYFWINKTFSNTHFPS